MHWVDGSKIGRNDDCRCGSGVKFKYCCITFIRELATQSAEQLNLGTYLVSTDLWPQLHSEDTPSRC